MKPSYSPSNLLEITLNPLRMEVLNGNCRLLRLFPYFPSNNYRDNIGARGYVLGAGVEVRKSLIANAGRGLFVAVDVAKNMIITGILLPLHAPKQHL